MKNIDKIKTMNELQADLFYALKSGTEEEQSEAFLEFANGIQDIVIEKAKTNISEQKNILNDENILVNRGIKKPLTTAERKYFNAVVEKRGFENVEETFPKTIIEEIFINLKQEHPILSRVDLKNTEVLARVIVADSTVNTAFWGDIPSDIKQLVINGFKFLDIRSSKLSGFVPVSKGILELGPDWLASYVITVITEIMATSLELAIVQGNGKNQPIGMMKKLSGSVDSVYPDKEKISLSNLEPKSLAGIRGAMAKAKTDNSNVTILVNPETYWTKLFHNLAFRTQNGDWVTDRLATGEEIITSYAVPTDTLIFGDLKQYFFGVSGNTVINKYTETLAIEDMDLYIAKFYGYGVAKNKNSFFIADISSINGAIMPALEVDAQNTGNNKENIITNITLGV